MKVLKIIGLLILTANVLIAADYQPMVLALENFVYYEQDTPVQDIGGLVEFLPNNLPRTVPEDNPWWQAGDKYIPADWPIPDKDLGIGEWCGWYLHDADRAELMGAPQQIEGFNVPEEVKNYWLQLEVKDDERVYLLRGTVFEEMAYMSYITHRPVWMKHPIWLGTGENLDQDLTAHLFPLVEHDGYVYQLVLVFGCGNYAYFKWESQEPELTKELFQPEKAAPPEIAEVKKDTVVKTIKYVPEEDTMRYKGLPAYENGGRPELLGYAGYWETQEDTSVYYGVGLRIPFNHKSRFWGVLNYSHFDARYITGHEWESHRFEIGLLYWPRFDFMMQLTVGFEYLPQLERFSQGPVISDILAFDLWPGSWLEMVCVYNSEPSWTWARYRFKHRIWSPGKFEVSPGVQGIFSGRIECPEIKNTIHRQWNGVFLTLEYWGGLWNRQRSLSPPAGVAVGYNFWNSLPEMEGWFLEFYLKL